MQFKKQKKRVKKHYARQIVKENTEVVSVGIELELDVNKLNHFLNKVYGDDDSQDGEADAREAIQFLKNGMNGLDIDAQMQFRPFFNGSQNIKYQHDHVLSKTINNNILDLLKLLK